MATRGKFDFKNSGHTRESKMGIVYVLTNAAMPGLVKIGMTDEDDANARIGQLYSTGVPLPFEIQYACKVDNTMEVEDALHVAFAPHRINPKREFFRMDPTQVIAIMKLLDKPDATAEISTQPTSVDESSMLAAARARERRPNLDFSEMGIPIGSVLEAVSNSEIRVVVASPKRVKSGEEEISLSAATQQLLAITYSVRPAPLWKYQDVFSAKFMKTLTVPTNKRNRIRSRSLYLKYKPNGSANWRGKSGFRPSNCCSTTSRRG